MPLRIDEIGPWSEIKLDILKKYAGAYSKILTAQKRFTHAYIDAFAGAGEHLSRSTGELVPGSPLNALSVQPAFKEFHLIDLDRGRIENLRQLVGDRADVMLYNDDCNRVLTEQVLPRFSYESFRKALCLLDPYGLSLKWQTVEMAGRLRSVEVFINFPVMGINRNVKQQDLGHVTSENLSRMDAFWGDRSWHDAMFRPSAQANFVWAEAEKDKQSGDDLAEAYRVRLHQVAGFAYVPAPIPMRNSKGNTVYYLFFASPNKTANRIVSEIFAKYRDYTPIIASGFERGNEPS
jgi:three-Cys-motif partner protein